MAPRDMKVLPGNLRALCIHSVVQGTRKVHTEESIPQAPAQQLQVIVLQTPSVPELYYHPHRAQYHPTPHDLYAMPSSEPDEIEDPELFPHVTKWLEDL